MADVTDTHRLIVNHIAAVRKIPGLEDAMAVMVLESNLAYEAQHVHPLGLERLPRFPPSHTYSQKRPSGFRCRQIIHALNRYKVPSWVALAEGAGGGVGWLTTNGESAECAKHTVVSLLVCVVHRKKGGDVHAITRRSERGLYCSLLGVRQSVQREKGDPKDTRRRTS